MIPSAATLLSATVKTIGRQASSRTAAEFSLKIPLFCQYGAQLGCMYVVCCTASRFEHHGTVYIFLSCTYRRPIANVAKNGADLVRIAKTTLRV